MLDFALDVSKQLLGLLTLQLLGTSQALSELLAEARKCGSEIPRKNDDKWKVFWLGKYGKTNCK